MPDSATVGYEDENGQFVPVNMKARDVVTAANISVESHIANSAAHLDNAKADKINGAVQITEIGAANGVAPLDETKQIPREYVRESFTKVTHHQTDPANIWQIEHKLDERYVHVQVIDSLGNTLIPDIEYMSSSIVKLAFATLVAGTAIIRR